MKQFPDLRSGLRLLFWFCWLLLCGAGQANSLAYQLLCLTLFDLSQVDYYTGYRSTQRQSIKPLIFSMNKCKLRPPSAAHFMCYLQGYRMGIAFEMYKSSVVFSHARQMTNPEWLYPGMLGRWAVKWSIGLGWTCNLIDLLLLVLVAQLSS